MLKRVDIYKLKDDQKEYDVIMIMIMIIMIIINRINNGTEKGLYSWYRLDFEVCYDIITINALKEKNQTN